MICPVSSMRNGQWGKLVEIEGEDDIAEKLASLGIRLGTRIGKKYGLMGRGPVVLIVGTAEVAIGYDMASRMRVELEDTEEAASRPDPRKNRFFGRGLFRLRRGRRGRMG